MENIDRTREELEEILSDREYQIYYEDNRNIIEIWWDDFVEWLMDKLTNIFPDLNPVNGLEDTVLFIMIVVVIALLGIAVFLIFRRVNLRRRFQNNQPLQSNRELDWTYEQHLVEANRQEKKKKYTKATRHLFLALLLYFHDKEWLVAKIWKTNLEYVEELRSVNKEHASEFYDIAQTFDEVVYGERMITHTEYDHFKEKILKLIVEDRTTEG